MRNIMLVHGFQLKRKKTKKKWTNKEKQTNKYLIQLWLEISTGNETNLLKDSYLLSWVYASISLLDSVTKTSFFFLKCGICNIFCDYLSTPTRSRTRADHLLQPKRGHSSLGLTWYGSSSTLQIGYSICETKIKRLLHNPQLLRFVYTLRKVTANLLIVDLF